MDTARTRGDGMENEALTAGAASLSAHPQRKSSDSHTSDIKLPSELELQRLLPHSGSHLVYRPTELVPVGNASLPPTVPKGKIFNLVPKLVPSCRAASGGANSGSSLKSREPKFVPFEPYKGAVNPIIPFKNNENRVKISDRNNLDLNVLVSQMSTITSKELKGAEADKKEFDMEKQKYAKEIDELKKERDYYQSQLKFQAQVNSELKNLLVAAVGEDLQTKVNVLTEDKLHLARKLLNSAENLSSHTEQIEFLAGQSEVWRSKFLASSLMVEELARWKASLLQKNRILLASNKEMLETTSKLREMQLDILRNLKFLSNRKDSLPLQSANALDLTAESVNISQQLVLAHSALGMPDSLDLTGLDPMCPAEKLAVQALQHSNEPLMNTDDAFRAIVGQAFPSINTMKQQMMEPPPLAVGDFVVVENPAEVKTLPTEQ